MLESMERRGPDEYGIISRGKVSMGSVRLSVLDRQSGQQPMGRSDGKSFMVYNGEVYNHVELRKVLQSDFFSACDTETVFKALEEWGPEKALRRFDGMFALAYYSHARDTLILARDRWGVKPLFIALESGGFLFASELKALFAAGVSQDVSIIAVASHLRQEFLEDGWTAFKRVKSLSPGEFIELSEGVIRRHRYYDLIHELDIDRLARSRETSLECVSEELQGLLRDSVRQSLMADGPVTAFCSGGLDSSTLCSLAAEEQGHLVAYVADVEGIVESEVVPARRFAASSRGIEIRTVPYTVEEYLRDWPMAVWLNEDPPVYWSDQALRAVCSAMHDDGFKVALSGDGADEVFGGYAWHRNVGYLFQEDPRDRGTKELTKNGVHGMVGSLANEWKFARFPVPEPFARIEALRNACVTNSGARFIRHQALCAKMEGSGYHGWGAAVAAACVNDMFGHLHSLLQRTDRMAMSVSIETRVPFLNNAIVEFGLHLDGVHKAGMGFDKRALRSAASTFLPACTASVEKTPFVTPTVPFDSSAQLLSDGVLRELLEWDEWRTMTLIREASSEVSILFSLVGLELWARIFVAGWNIDELGDLLVANHHDQARP